MNLFFVIVFLVASFALCLRDPAAFLPALLDGAKDAVALCMSLACVYAVWLGFLKIAEDAGVLRGMSRAMRPITRRLFRTDNPAALEKIAVNLSANFLGMGGAATSAGVDAMRLLAAEGEFSRAMFFVVNCAGVQLLSTTVLSLRAAAGAAQAFDVVLPILLSSVLALLVGAGLVFLVYGRTK